jgi:hypothetical protein
MIVDPPAPPRDLIATAVPSSPAGLDRLDVLLTWYHDGAEVAWFEIDRQRDGEGWKVFARVLPRFARGGEDGDANAHRDAAAPYRREVRYRVVAIGENGNRSAWSPIAATEAHTAEPSDHPASG